MRNERLAGLDMWRALLPFIGVAYHAFTEVTTQYGAPGIFLSLSIATHAFRMEAFFALAGLLAGARLARSGYGLSRTRTLLVPFASLYVLCLLAKGGEARSMLTGSTIHLWFLLTLTAVTLFAITAERVGAIAAMLERWQESLVLLMVWALLARATGMARSELIYSVTASIGPLAIYYAPFFLAGVIAARSEGARDAAHRWRGAWKLGCVGSILLVARTVVDGTTQSHATLLGGTVLTITAALWVVGVLGTGVGHGTRPAGPASRWLGEAGYTVYILHFPVLLASFRITGNMHWVPCLAVGLVASAAVPLAAHAMAQRLPLLRFLLNGTIPPSGNWVSARRARA